MIEGEKAVTAVQDLQGSQPMQADDSAQIISDTEGTAVTTQSTHTMELLTKAEYVMWVQNSAKHNQH